MRRKKTKNLSHQAQPPVKQAGGKAKIQPFSEHVRELRRRAIYSIGTLLLASVAGFFIHKQLFTIITRPLNQQLYYTTPAGGFNAIIKISIIFGLLVTTPVLIYQLGKFLSPAFKRRIHAAPIILFSTLLAAAGILFAYLVSLPAALHFLANVDSKNLQSIITIDAYLSFLAAYLVGFALLFQLPLVMIFINRIKPQRPGRLMRIQRWVFLFSFIMAAILTPTPDPMNQFIMAAPIILLYQFSVIAIWFINRKKAIPASAANQSEPAAEPEYIPAEIAIPALTRQLASYQRRPHVIMDIFWIPHNPAK